jgi:4-alpha-glucanotransferase
MHRTSGLVLHPTSLPGRYGIGDFGPTAFQFIDFLVAARQQRWKILPLGPTSYGDSPYQCLSAMAGNPLLLSPEMLLQRGYVSAADLADLPDFPQDKVDYCAVRAWKSPLLQRAFARFQAKLQADAQDANPGADAREFAAFCSQHAFWLDDFASFCAIKQQQQGQAWQHWPTELRQRQPQALASWQADHADAINYHRFIQFEFFRQWAALKRYANQRGIRIIGDLPIFVALDSADVWANQDLFELDGDGNAIVVAGVPPDYFSATGQRWGNPLYRWQRMAQDNYGWWQQRLKLLAGQVDCMRIDHFCGFENYWAIPGSEATAVNGRWIKGPGQHFFDTIKQHLGQLDIIAEDLGILTPEVVALRENSGLPGMRVLHYAFGSGNDNPYLPHHYVEHCVAYTGTHDNNTTRGWFRSMAQHERDHLQHYFGRGFDEGSISFEMTRAVWHSKANTVLIPLQDALNLDERARMNYPGSMEGNWAWRYRSEQLTPQLGQQLAGLNAESGRE